MKVLVGVCGGIAAYKAAELVRALQRSGAEVEVGMTASAEKFVMPLTFAALTGKQPYTSLWTLPANPAEGYEIEHIAVAQEIDAVVIAPATANTIAKLAHGLADDFLSTLALATRAPMVLAPAMNVNMWEHAATQQNVETLRSRGVRFVLPEAGYLACGMVGSGRLATVEAIAAEVLHAAAQVERDLQQETVLITAGGTREPIDPVRYLGNRSSGRMGYAIAEAAVARGAKVVLVSAAELPAPAGCEVVRATSADAMRSAVLEHLPRATVMVGAAAVADFRVREVAEQKIRRTGPMTLELEPTEDIVKEVVERRRADTLVIAFAAETQDAEESGRAKLLRKGADAIVINDVSQSGVGFESERNAGLFLTAERRIELPEMSKRAMADHILDEVILLRAGQIVLSAKK